MSSPLSSSDSSSSSAGAGENVGERSADSSDEEQTVATIAAKVVFPAVLTALRARIRRKRKHGGSRVGRAPNRDIGMRRGAWQIQQDFFVPLNQRNEFVPTLYGPIFKEVEFERRYRVSKSQYEIIRSGILATDDYFELRADCTGKLGASTDQKVLLSLELLATGETSFRGVKDYRLSDSLANECLKRFCRALVKHFAPVYLRRPTPMDLKEIEAQYAKLRCPGCIGCLDCASWYWEMCPVAEQGQHKGKDKKPALRMEVICDDRLRIWHMFFGAPGAWNDINILNMSPLFQEVRAGNWPTVKPDLDIAGMKVDWYFWLTDQIYPRFKIFSTTIGDPSSRKEKLYASAQEGGRKAVERVFGNLFKRFMILRNPSRFWYKIDMANIIAGCSTLHNMIITSQEDYEERGTRNIKTLIENASAAPQVELRRINDTYDQADAWRGTVDEIENEVLHMKLKKALMDHMWEQSGDIELDD